MSCRTMAATCSLSLAAEKSSAPLTDTNTLEPRVQSMVQVALGHSWLRARNMTNWAVRTYTSRPAESRQRSR